MCEASVSNRSKLAISALWFYRLDEDNRSDLNGNNRNLNYDNRVRGIAQCQDDFIMEQDNIYPQIYSMRNLFFAYKKARRGKTKKYYVMRFEKNLPKQILTLNMELKSQKYSPEPLRTFILRDPKTRKISKSAFRDRVVHHALVRVIEPIFDKSFIYDSCANRKGKGNLFALKRFDLFKRKVTNNLKSEAFCLKADVKHYFQEVNHKILIEIIKRKIKDEEVIWLINQIFGGGANRAKVCLWEI